MISTDVTKLVETTVEGMGYEFVGIELVSQRHSKLLRIYIDGKDGVLIDDCAVVSRQLSGVFDVEDPISGQYQLEVSSPGVERPLFKIEDYQRFKGQEAFVDLYEIIDGQRKVRGLLDGIHGDKVLMKVEEHVIEMPYSSIRKARLVGKLNMGRKKGS